MAERAHDALLLTCLGCYASQQVLDHDPLVLAFLEFESEHEPCDPRPAQRVERVERVER